MLFAFTLFLGVQMVLWQRFSIDMSWLMVKRITGQASIDDWLDIGGICNSLGKFSCSVEAFQEVLQRQPRQRSALANLAIAYCHLEQWKESQPYFEAYFSLGGDAYDTMFWYARALVHLGEKERGTEWYFKSLTKNGQFIEAAKELVDQLVETQKIEEALSLIGHLGEGHPEQDVFWGQKVMSINSFMQTSEEFKKRERVTTLKVPSLTGDHYYLPAWFAESGPVHFLLVDDSQSEVVLDRSIVDPELLREEVKKRQLKDSQKLERLEIPRWRLGPWWMGNVTVDLCESCQSRVGSRMLNHLGMKEWSRFGVSFILFSPKE